jgi:hypothetical protein
MNVRKCVLQFQVRLCFKRRVLPHRFRSISEHIWRCNPVIPSQITLTDAQITTADAINVKNLAYMRMSNCDIINRGY